MVSANTHSTLQLLQIGDPVTYTILKPSAVPATDVQQATNALASLPAHNPLRNFFEQQLAAVTRGADLSVLEEDKELTPNEVASLLQVSHPYVMKQIRKGSLNAHAVGSHYRVKQSDLLDFMDRRDRAGKHVAEVLAAPRVRRDIELTENAFAELRNL